MMVQTRMAPSHGGGTKHLIINCNHAAFCTYLHVLLAHSSLLLGSEGAQT